LRRAHLASLALPALLGALLSGPVPAVARARHPPIVMLVWDEFSWTALLDSHGRIDARRFPNIAALARRADVFPRYTAPGDETAAVMTSLLAGAHYDLGASPGYGSHPSNLFTRLHAAYRLRVSEEVTGFCPHPICPGDFPPGSTQGALSRIAHGRTQRFAYWLHRIVHTQRPTLFFKHALLPHGPAVYLPSGQRYNGAAYEPIPGLNGPLSFGDPWFARQALQRYILQVELADRLVGKLVARLHRTRMFDRSVVVMTADNGEGFGHRFSDPHRIDGRTAAAIAGTPLIIKEAGQRRQRVITHHVRTIDVEPTILRLAGLGAGGLPGRPAIRRHAGIPSGITLVDDFGRRRHFSARGYSAALRGVVRRQAAVFGHGIYGIGPAHHLVGRRLAKLRLTRAHRLRTYLRHPGALHAVRRTGFLLPVFVIARLVGRPVARGVAFAVAVNGRIAATGRTARIAGSRRTWAAAIVPPSSLRAGVNHVAIVLIGRHGKLEKVP
jgi:Sulfatase